MTASGVHDLRFIPVCSPDILFAGGSGPPGATCQQLFEFSRAPVGIKVRDLADPFAGGSILGQGVPQESEGFGTVGRTRFDPGQAEVEPGEVGEVMAGGL